jgi:hypothetical protein
MAKRQAKPSHSYKGADLLRIAARPAWFFYLLIWLMVLLAAGTISEKYIGLYLAQKIFFASYVIWIGGIIPSPGGYTTLTLIFFNLLAKLISENWTMQKAGTLVTHCGALLLLLGGFLTAAFSTEGSVVIEPGQSSGYVEDYHRHELAVTDGKTETVFNANDLAQGQKLGGTSLPFTISTEQLCDNCVITQRAAQVTDGSVHGMLVANDMQPVPIAPDDAKNIPGIIYRITGAGADKDGLYALFEDMPITQHLAIGDKTYSFDFRRERRALPFEIDLVKFDKQLYPGTDKPRAFQSDVIVKDGDLNWHSLITMNHPLRYKGYTFYQSSFIDRGNGEATVLTAVKNVGAIFP